MNRVDRSDKGSNYNMKIAKKVVGVLAFDGRKIECHRSLESFRRGGKYFGAQQNEGYDCGFTDPVDRRFRYTFVFWYAVSAVLQRDGHDHCGKVSWREVVGRGGRYRFDQLYDHRFLHGCL